MRKLTSLILAMLCVMCAAGCSPQTVDGVDFAFEVEDVERVEMYHYDGVPKAAEKKLVTDEGDIKQLYDLFSGIELQTKAVEETSGASVTAFRFNLNDGSSYELIYGGYGVKNGSLKSPTDAFEYFTASDVGWYWEFLNRELEAVPAKESELPGYGTLHESNGDSEPVVTESDTENPPHEAASMLERRDISREAFEELSVMPHMTYKANYTEAAQYLGIDLLINPLLEESITGEGIDIQGSYSKGEAPITSVALYGSHNTGGDVSGHIDVMIYITLEASEEYPQTAQMNDVPVSQYVSDSGIAAHITADEQSGRAGAYFVHDGIFYAVTVVGFGEEDSIDVMSYLKAIINGFEP